jgi:phosphatidylinositol alpha-1,6-mannosyltransferase
VPPQRPAQLTAAFEKLITDPALRRQLGEAGRTWARRHEWTQSAETLFPAAEIVP